MRMSLQDGVGGASALEPCVTDTHTAVSNMGRGSEQITYGTVLLSERM
jgi:hypothetical protein